MTNGIGHHAPENDSKSNSKRAAPAPKAGKPRPDKRTKSGS